MSARTPGPWEWWTSNSWRRLVHQIGGTQIPVLTPYVCRDGHPDLQCSAGNMALIASAPDLLALAHQYASECGECAGTRVCPDDSACIECADIWRVIDKAERRT